MQRVACSRALSSANVVASASADSKVHYRRKCSPRTSSSTFASLRPLQGAQATFTLRSPRRVNASRTHILSLRNQAASSAAEPPAEAPSKSSSIIPMHDFCMTIPYGFIIALGGVMGFVMKGSTKSLMMGGGSGALLMILGFFSLTIWKSGKSALPVTIICTVLSSGLTAMMGKRWMMGAGMMPSGIIAIMSGIMVLFYLKNMLTGGNPLPQKEESENKDE
ncbi:hypothetical protein CYMTET_24531 [Cymbomonas tetramitiformis]|uniref:Uncharacterized protein n=1 Tax=Cymbomonas tetramitiformis TaxID=36881 RepID=A0AAE0FW59_9CHLO|nr:hypothetical protein CYMTET_24531 [Cymbomonas tetramitiformis]